MKNRLEDLYGRRITPGVKIFVLVVIIFLGMHLAFNGAGHSEKTHPDTTIVE